MIMGKNLISDLSSLFKKALQLLSGFISIVCFFFTVILLICMFFSTVYYVCQSATRVCVVLLGIIVLQIFYYIKNK